MTVPAHPTLSPLSDFIHEAFLDLAISTDDTVAEAALERLLSPHVQETDVATGAVTSRAGYREIIKSLRAEFTDRKLVKNTYVIATPADASNRTGAAAATHVMSALQDGVPVTATLVAVVRVEWVHEDGHQHGGRRQVVTEATLLNVRS